MAISSTAAIIGGAAIGAGASVISGREQADAASDAAALQSDAAGRQIDLARDVYTDQRGLYEPHRQYELQQLNAMAEIFGFDPVSYEGGSDAPQNALTSGQSAVPDLSQFGAYVDSYDGLGRAYGQLSLEDRRYIAEQGYDVDGNGQISPEEWGAYHYDTHGQGEGRQLPPSGNQPQSRQQGDDKVYNALRGGPAGTATSNRTAQQQLAPLGNPTTATVPAANTPAGTPDFNVPAPYTAPSMMPTTDEAGNPAPQRLSPAMERFQGTPYYELLQGDIDFANTDIGNALSAQGLMNSSANLNAREMAQGRLSTAAFQNYMAGLTGTAPSNAAAATSAAAGQFGVNAGNGIINQGNALAQGQLGQGAATAGIAGNIGQLGMWGAGQYAGSRPVTG